MSGQQPQENRFEYMNEFEQPTEPMSQVFLSPFFAPTHQTGIPSGQNSVPAPQLDERPFPKSAIAPVDVFNYPVGAPPGSTVLPPDAQEGYNDRRPGKTQPRVNAGKDKA